EHLRSATRVRRPALDQLAYGPIKVIGLVAADQRHPPPGIVLAPADFAVLQPDHVPDLLHRVGGPVGRGSGRRRQRRTPRGGAAGAADEGIGAGDGTEPGWGAEPGSEPDGGVGAGPGVGCDVGYGPSLIRTPRRPRPGSASPPAGAAPPRPRSRRPLPAESRRP